MGPYYIDGIDVRDASGRVISDPMGSTRASLLACRDNAQLHAREARDQAVANKRALEKRQLEQKANKDRISRLEDKLRYARHDIDELQREVGTLKTKLDRQKIARNNHARDIASLGYQVDGLRRRLDELPPAPRTQTKDDKQ